MQDTFLHDPDWLRARYIDDQLSLQAIADLAGVVNRNRTTVARALRRYGIPVRSISQAKTGRTRKGQVVSEETRRKLSEARKGRPNTAVWTPEAREALAAKRRGQNNPMFGTASPVRRLDDYDPDRRVRQNRTVRRFRYGLTEADYEAMLVEQDGVCAICHQAESKQLRGRVIKMSIDHCHVALRVRGLLCHRCNVILGLSHDDPAILQSAIAYLGRALAEEEGVVGSIRAQQEITHNRKLAEQDRATRLRDQEAARAEYRVGVEQRRLARQQLLDPGEVSRRRRDAQQARRQREAQDRKPRS